MPTPTRFTNGLTTAKKTQNLGNYGDTDPTKWATYFDDFHTYTAANHTVTVVGTGTQALSSNVNGTLTLTNSAADNDSVFSQKTGSNFFPEAGKKTIFKARFSVSDQTQSDWIIGIYASDTAPFSTGGGGDDVSDGLYFGKEDGSTNIDFYFQKNTTTGQKISLAVATAPANDVYFTLGFEFDGVQYCHLFKDDVKIKSVDLGTTLSAYLPDILLRLGWGIVNGEAVAKTLNLDYVFVAQER